MSKGQINDGHLGLVHLYLKIFASGKDFDHLTIIFHPDLHFHGPLFQSSSARTYIDALKTDPPKGVQILDIEISESGNEIVANYTFVKPDISPVSMQQTFTLENNLIKTIRLEFDPSLFQV